MLAPFFSARAISPFLLAKDTAIVNAVNERFGLADRAYVAERKYKAHMSKLERAERAQIRLVQQDHVLRRQAVQVRSLNAAWSTHVHALATRPDLLQQSCFVLEVSCAALCMWLVAPCSVPSVLAVMFTTSVLDTLPH
jgi:hypothetical protein